MVKKKPVNVNLQSIFMFIPIVDLWAAYRIKKLRIYLLIFYLGFSIAGIIMDVVILGSEAYLMDENYDIMDDFLNIPLVIGSIIVAVFSLALSIYFIRKWSKKWNEQFEKQSEDNDTQ